MAFPEASGAVDRALDFLAAAQLPSGQFPMEFTVTGGEKGVAGPAGTHPERSPFCTAYVAGSLMSCDDPRATTMIGRAVAFLESEKIRGGLWRYWCRDAPLHSQIPPDVDDTACISELIRRVTGRAPANEELLLANRTSSGLFHTWITLRWPAPASPAWWSLVLGDLSYGRLVTFWRAGASRHDVDSVVNANVLLYLGAREEMRPVVEWLEKIAAAGREAESDKWYRSRAAFYYAVSRCFASELVPADSFVDHTKRAIRASDDDSNDLETAMMLCAAMNFRVEPGCQQRMIERLIGSQARDGSWASYPIYFDGRPRPLISWGSSAVTTGFCVEALSRAGK